MSGLGNPYYNPEEFGLEIIHSIEDEPDYDFDMLIVWRRPSDDTLYWAHDSGCSCPSPFEDYHSLDDLTPLTAETYLDFQVEADAFAGLNGIDELQLAAMLHDVQRRLGIFPGA